MCQFFFIQSSILIKKNKSVYFFKQIADFKVWRVLANDFLRLQALAKPSA